MASSDNWILLRRLKTAVKKIKFLLNFNIHQFLLTNRRLSFNQPPQGLIVCMDQEPESESLGPLLRTASGLSGAGGQSDDDIDNKADIFISNFYRQLRIERQISLELHYCRGNSFSSVSA
ncbi:uncharacterized protein LOC124929874 [Impatiens glandulifera]|uniref:uncharacterized protein LOC124929874 n=1 Tax=Impatiens glandulifera TaxID=253017 RepID=UPI001FB172C9|nr:uncharacterized protein LOC124929874 [Impatiens glandulifera]